MNPETLIITLAERFGLIVAGAFLLLTITPIHRIGFRQSSPRTNTILQILIFGICGILGTYGGKLRIPIRLQTYVPWRLLPVDCSEDR
ncbi:hypothetical protein [Maridesulfovibrio sp.]|uniref:hypothetical protein n=1 Tax=Maridesulfovibrio sp. TaxID=2795000 RepID=UPI0039F0EE4E